MTPVQLFVDCAEIDSELTAALRGARSSIDLQMLTFEGDPVGLRYAGMLARKAREGVRVRVLIDYYTCLIQSDVFVFPGYFFSGALRRELRSTRCMLREMRGSGALVRLTNRPRGFIGSLFRRNHKKMVVVDRERAYLGGVNLSEHNFAWHDLILRLEGGMAARLGEDFSRTWEGKRCPAEFPPEDGITFIGSSRLLKARVDALIENAKHEIFLESPYAGGWVLDRLASAAARGLTVAVIVPSRNNYPFFSLLHRYYEWKYSRAGLRFHRYTGNGGMTHLKALLIDDTAVLGSSNFSMHFMEESAVIAQRPDLAADLKRRVFEEDKA